MVIISSSNANVKSDTWQHVSFTYNKSTSNVNLFINDQLVGFANNVFINLDNSSNDFFLGHDNNNNNIDDFFEGAMDDILIYNKELNSKELNFIRDSNQTDLFLKSKLVGHWSFDQFTNIVDNFFDHSTYSNNGIVSGTLMYGSEVSKGNKSIKFDGTSSIIASNISLHPNYMSVGAWVNPSTYGQPFVKKNEVFEFGINSSGTPHFQVGDTVPTGLKFRPYQDINDSPNNFLHAHYELDDDFKDYKNIHNDAYASNVTFTNSYNMVGHKCAQLNGSNSFINIGNVLNDTNPNKITLSSWVNLQELQSGKSYPIMSLNNGFEWWISKDYNNDTSINFYPLNKSLVTINTFDILSGIGSFNITSAINRNYFITILTQDLDLDKVDNIDIIKNIGLTTELKFRVREKSPYGRIDFSELQLFDHNDNLIEYEAVLHGNYDISRGNAQSLNDNIKNPGAIYATGADYNVDDILITITPKHATYFATLSYFKLFYFRPKYGPGFDILNQNNEIIAQSTTTSASDPDYDTTYNTLALMNTNGLYHQVNVNNVITSDVNSQTYSFTTNVVHTIDGTNYPLNHVNEAYVYVLLNGGLLNETLVYKQHIQALDNKPYVSFNYTTQSSEITTTGFVYSAYANVTTIKLIAFHDVLNISSSDIENLPSMIDFDVVSIFEIFEVNHTLTQYYSDLSGSTQPIDDSKSYTIVFYVKDALGSEITFGM